MEEFGILLFIVLLAVGRAIFKKVLGGGQAAKARRPLPAQPQEGKFQASQDQIHQFLQDIGEQRDQPEQARPVQQPVPVQQAAVQPDRAAPAQPRLRSKKRRTAKRAPGKSAPAAAGVAAAATRKATPAALKLAGGDLKKAIIWSEILRSPVCLRGGFGHKPPIFDK